MRLRRFNKSKQLKELHHKLNENIDIKKRTIILSVLILFVAIIYFTFARYEENKTFTLIDATVGEFFLGYLDGTIATPPKIYTGLVPVTIDDSGETKGTIRIADVSSEWYNYADHKWANAVVPTQEARSKSVGDVLSEDEILQMYVWIPRYRYKLWNAEYGVSDEQAIEIEFESAKTPKSEGSTNGEWLTHPAFTFGNDVELNGIWVGKFETNKDKKKKKKEEWYDMNNLDGKIIIKPNVAPMYSDYLDTYINASIALKSLPSYNFDPSQIDTHAMKNMEWGAATYLTFSIYGRYIDSETCVESGCEPWVGKEMTGSSGGSKNDNGDNSYPWNDQTYGGNISTTGNVYGIYGMSGCIPDIVIANVSESSDSYTWTPGYSYGDKPEDKYFDHYLNTFQNSQNYIGGQLGDATREVMKRNDGSSSMFWYDNESSNTWKTYTNNFGQTETHVLPWIKRGGFAYKSSVDSRVNGVFALDGDDGNRPGRTMGFRIVITESDMEDSLR